MPSHFFNYLDRFTPHLHQYQDILHLNQLLLHRFPKLKIIFIHENIFLVLNFNFPFIKIIEIFVINSDNHFLSFLFCSDALLLAV